ncbi:MAG TPA: ABC transporter ATP-binding protein [Nitrospira sp.]|nr:ABC transporter ATP-binding protein [Nitrospira sp.]
MIEIKQPIIEVRDLVVEYKSHPLPVRALDAVDFTASADETVGFVGESGSGKSTLAMALGGVSRSGVRPSRGSVQTFGRDVFALRGQDRRRFLSEDIGFVFQNPIGSLDPTRRIGHQFFTPDGQPLNEKRVEELLSSVGLEDTGRIMASFPHEVSGGMAQRVCIAMAISVNPPLLIADEPTAALDASVKTQILDLLTELRARARSTLILVSHDLHSVRKYCDRVCVMYGGRIVEAGPSRDVFDCPRHPYTAALLRSIPGFEGPGGRIEPIPGYPPSLNGQASNCTFAPRCALQIPVCRENRPPVSVEGDRTKCCWLPGNEIGMEISQAGRGYHA